MAYGYGPIEIGVHLQVLPGRRQVLARQRVVLLVQEHLGDHRARLVVPHHQRPAREHHLVHRSFGVPARHAVLAARRPLALADDTPPLRGRHRDVEGEQVAPGVRVPEPVAREIDALGADRARRLAEAPGVLLLLIRQPEVEHAAIRDRDLPVVPLESHPVPLQRGRRRLVVAGVDPEKRPDVAQGHLAYDGRGRGERQLRAEQEVGLGGVPGGKFSRSVTSSRWEAGVETHVEGVMQQRGGRRRGTGGQDEEAQDGRQHECRTTRRCHDQGGSCRMDGRAGSR